MGEKFARSRADSTLAEYSFSFSLYTVVVEERCRQFLTTEHIIMFLLLLSFYTKLAGPLLLLFFSLILYTIFPSPTVHSNIKTGLLLHTNRQTKQFFPALVRAFRLPHKFFKLEWLGSSPIKQKSDEKTT